MAKRTQLVFDRESQPWYIIKYTTNKTTIDGQVALDKAGLYIMTKDTTAHTIHYYNPTTPQNESVTSTQSLKSH
ncbi:polysaccharide lyase beta-sandwich domain-containing protein [Streptococcus gallinaceus]